MELLFEDNKVYLKGVLTVTGERNRNGRLYPKHIMEAEIGKLNDRIKAGVKVYAEKEHPIDYIEIREDAPNTCGIFREVTWFNESFDGFGDGYATCKIEILADRPKGKELIAELKAGKEYGISTRAGGSLTEDMTVDMLLLETADIVAMPSCQVCYLTESGKRYEDVGDMLQLEKKERTPCEIIDSMTEEEINRFNESVMNNFINVFK